MGERLIIRYDEIGSFLFLEVCNPYAEQDSNEIDDAVLARFNLKTGEMESVEILFFESWLKHEGEIRIPVNAIMRPVNAAAPKALAPASAADATLTIKFDHVDDILTIDQGNKHPGQAEAEIGEGISARLNPETGEIENLEIRCFKARLEKDGEIILPINATLRPVKYAVPAD